MTYIIPLTPGTIPAISVTGKESSVATGGAELLQWASLVSTLMVTFLLTLAISHSSDSSLCQTSALKGSYPKEIGRPLHLRGLNSGYNSLEGGIPATFTNCSNLQYIFLSFYKLVDQSRRILAFCLNSGASYSVAIASMVCSCLFLPISPPSPTLLLHTTAFMGRPQERLASYLA